jgi:integrase
MARLAKAKLTTKTARLKLDPDRYHFTSVAPRVALGYTRAGATPAPGRWVVRVELSRTDTGSQQRVRRTIGVADDLQAAHTYDQARNLPAESRVIDYSTAVRIASVFDPSDPDTIPAPRGERLTVEQAAEAYLRHLEAQKGASAAGDARNKLTVHVLPKLGPIAVADLTLDRLRRWQAELVRGDDADAQRRSRSTANRTTNTLKACLNFVFRGDDAGRVPTDKAWRGLKSFRGADASREHHFTEGQIQTLINAARKTDPHFADLLEAGFWTGARYGEIARLEVGNFDARRRQLHFPSRITKTAKARSVILVPEAVAFFSRVARGHGKGELLMLRGDGQPWGKSHQSRPMKAALAAAKLNTAASFYALRHSVASRMIEAGAPLTLVAQQLGTSVRMLEKAYAHMLQEKERELVHATAPRLTLVRGGRRVA